MGALIRAHDWADTRLGPCAAWPPPLRTTLRLMLNTGHPMYIFWGPELICFYNDAYRASIGPERHPHSLGQPGRGVWDEIWPIIGPQIEQVMSGGGATWHENHLVPITRYGRREDVYWTYSYGPIDDEFAPHGVGGVLVMCTETTQQVLVARERAAEVERLDRMFQQAPGAIAVLRGPGHVFEIANPAYLDLVGHRELLGRSVADALPEVVEQGFIDLLDQVYRTNQPYVGKDVAVDLQRTSRKSPDQRMLDFVYQPLLDQGGAVTGIFVQATDVTERAHAEADLRQSEAQFRFLDALNKATQSADGASSIVATAAQCLGEHLDVAVCAYAHVETGGDTFTVRGEWTKPGIRSLLGTYRLDDFGAIAARLLRAGQPFVTRDTVAELGPEEAEAFLKLGLRATVCMPLMKDGRLTAMMAVHHDEPRVWSAPDIALVAETAERCWAHIERVRSDASLRQSEARFRAAVEAVEGVTWTNDAEGRMKGEQPGWAALTGQSFDQYQDFGWADAVHPDDTAGTIEAWNDAVAGYRAFVYEHRVRRASDGAWRLFSIRAIPALNSDGSVREWVGVHTDVTELRDLTANLELRVAEEVAERSRTEEALRQAQKMEAIGQLTGGVAHDFNNLLTVIRSSADLLRRPNLPEERRRRYIDAIADTADRAAKLTGQLLAFARRQALKPEVFEITDRVDAISEMLRTILGSRILLEIERPAEACFVEADTAQFETALVNMAVNARDAMDGEGTLTIKIACAEAIPPLRGQRAAPGDFVAVVVRDTGEGIAAEDLPRIFEPFFTTKEIGRGTGLGLSQVYGFAKQSGGEVEVESERGAGSTFTLFLPRVARPAEDAVAVGEVPLEGAEGRVLIVEDNAQVGDFASQLLQDLGYQTTLAGDGLSALRRMEESAGAYDVVFSDVVMPGIGGVDLGHRIHARWPRIPVILTTGYSDALAADARHGFPLLRKPYSVDELSRVLQDAMRNRRPAPK